MKKIIIATLLLFFISVCSAQDDTGKVYLIRPYNVTGSMATFKWYVDGEITCNTKNIRHSIHEIPAGEHTITVQLYGKSQKDDAPKILLNVEAGKTYYLQAVFVPELLIQEILQSSADAVLKNSKLVTDCN